MDPAAPDLPGVRVGRQIVAASVASCPGAPPSRVLPHQDHVPHTEDRTEGKVQAQLKSLWKQC